MVPAGRPRSPKCAPQVCAHWVLQAGPTTILRASRRCTVAITGTLTWCSPSEVWSAEYWHLEVCTCSGSRHLFSDACMHAGEHKCIRVPSRWLLHLRLVQLPRQQTGFLLEARTARHGAPPWQCVHRLRLHRVRCSNCLCGFAGECRQPQMHTGWLPQGSGLWLPRGQKSAVWHASTRRHGGDAAAMP